MPGKLVAPSLRTEALQARRLQKMAASAHAFVRGSTDLFYEWLSGPEVPKSMPEGPEVWICGDCHTGNLGPIADLEGNIEIQIRDLDQTVIGNPAHDLLRLGLSMAMAARSSDLPGVTTALIIEASIEGYMEGLGGHYAGAKAKEIPPIEKVLASALKRKWRNLAEERIKNVKPTIPLGTSFWPLTKFERKLLTELVEDRKEREFLDMIARTHDKKVALADAAYWVKGCSSLGRVRYAALIRAGKQHRLIDIKEAVKSAAPAAKGAHMPGNQAERIVAGAKALSPFLGERMLAAGLGGHQVFIRELRPQDIKFDLSLLTQREAVLTARLFASVVGKAHGRQMKADVRGAWRKELKTGHTKSLDAPSWLWNSVVDLISSHEAAYLRHCRRFALAPKL